MTLDFLQTQIANDFEFRSLVSDELKPNETLLEFTKRSRGLTREIILAERMTRADIRWHMRQVEKNAAQQKGENIGEGI